MTNRLNLSDCCGQHAVCEHLPTNIPEQIDYFDDEELDELGGIASEYHTEQAIEAFREVLYTLRPDEVIDWLTSLQHRNINLPDPLVDEAFFIVEEQRNMERS